MYVRGRPKTKILKIRCSEETYIRFRKIAAEFKDYEEALNVLMDNYKERRIKGIIL